MKNDYEIKKQERERIRNEQRKRALVRKKIKSLLRFSIWVVILVLIGYGGSLFMRSTAPQGEDFSTAYTPQEAVHIASGSSHSPYNSNPSSSGWHYAQPANGGFYNESISDETVIHNLEHGDIWIAYHPRISDTSKSVLKKFSGRYVIVSPRSENEGDISLVAWGRVDTFNIENGAVDEQRIEDFIRRYDNRGPEKVRGVQTDPGGF
ncbi:MAG TPA: DUF3105 domain-containing protein [Candidatus Jorgensenbacteria bacterium]|nr:DUF3105 domain-containing protein [Candidatus Jorgensenbacteria bacterium]